MLCNVQPVPDCLDIRICALQIHWFSIINSCVTVLLLTGFLATILMRVLKNDFVKYTRDDEGGCPLLACLMPPVTASAGQQAYLPSAAAAGTWPASVHRQSEGCPAAWHPTRVTGVCTISLLAEAMHWTVLQRHGAAVQCLT